MQRWQAVDAMQSRQLSGKILKEKNNNPLLAVEKNAHALCGIHH